jgi:outer membrane protein TolC
MNCRRGNQPAEVIMAGAVVSRFRMIPLLALLLISAAPADLLTLGDAEHAAVTTGYDMRAQYFGERAKEWEKWNAVASYLPTVGYKATYVRMDPESYDAARAILESMGQMGGGGMPLTPAEMARSPFAMYERSLKHEFEINQPITNGGMEVVAIGIARNTKRAVELLLEAARQEVLYNTRKAYFDALAAAERAQVADQALSWNRQNLAKAQVRHEAGAIPYTDVLQWEAAVAEKEGELLQARAVERFMLLSLFQAMGVPVDRADTTVNLQPLQVFEAWYDRGPAETDGSVETNPTLLSVRAYTEVSRRAKQIALGQMLPSLNAFVNYGWPAYDSILPPENTRGWTAGFVASVPIFKGFQGVTNYRKVKYEHDKTVTEEQRTANQFAVNLDRIAAFYKAAYGKVAASRKQNALMEKQLTIMQQRYDAGLVNQSQLLEVELGARQTRIGYIQALFDCLLLDAEYKQNIGQLEVSQ